jgi:hypothetical protein
LRQKRAIFRQIFSFLKEDSSAIQLKKGKKMAENLPVGRQGAVFDQVTKFKTYS